MVNGNYMVYGDRPVSESEIVDDHVHTRTAERRAKRKLNRSANDLQRTLNMAQLDNDTDSVKYEKKTKEPKLLRYVPTTDVEEHFVNENFETYDVKLEETPRRYAFTKKPKNPTDGSVHYAYSRSSSSCSSPGGNLPTIAEHVEQYGTYRVRAPPSPTDIDILKSFNNNNNFNNNKLDKYFVKPKEVKKYAAKGSHPDSLYRVAPGSGTGGGKVARVLRLLRWPAALVIVCMALAVFVYFLMPDSIDSDSDIVNGTYWENNGAGAQSQHTRTLEPDKTVLPMKPPEKKPSRTLHHGTKTTEIDFYDVESEKTVDIQSILDKLRDEKVNRKLPIAPVFPTHISPEVQYGNEKADVDKLRSPKLLVDDVTVLPLDSTLRPHITQHPEKPLAIYFNKDTTTSTETLTEVQTSSNFVRHDNNKTNNAAELDQEKQGEREEELNSEPEPPPEIEFENVKTIDSNMNFTSGHSKLFGISIEDAEKMKSTTQSALYNTKVSPTLPVWRDDDDTTTLKYPVNSPEGQPQCRSTRLGLCRGILPYDLAMMTATSPAGVDLASLLPQIEYLVASNCSDRVKHFVCALLEPECSAPLNQPKLPCYSLCQAIIDNCDGGIPRELASTFDCRRYPASDCWGSNPPCYLREIQCSDGSCVPRDYICDGKRDCPAGEDESQCVQCSRYEFRCPRDSICIQKQWVCDGYADCPSGDDETEASCAEIGVAAPRAEPTQGELGEEIAGSAPEPSVRRPNRLPSVANDKDVNSHRAEYESSKELLMTSDSSNGLRRNYTRRPKPSQRLNMYNQEPVQKEMIKDEAPKPEDQEENPEYRVENTQYSRFRGQTPVDQTDSKLDIVYARGNPSRLTPYSRPKPIGENIVESKQPSSTSRFTKTEDKNYRRQGSSKPKTKQGDEDATAINVGDLNFDAKEPGKENLAQTAQSPDKVSSSLSHLDKTINKLERILNGAALLSKAQKDLDKDATPPPDDYDLARENMTRTDPEMTTKGFASDEQPISSHASPCPSGELRCVDGRCITLAQLCDGTIDCSDHADEDNCYT